jgi:hypothetical protein
MVPHPGFFLIEAGNHFIVSVFDRLLVESQLLANLIIFLAYFSKNESVGLKIITLRSPLMASPAYQISLKIYKSV